MNQLTVETPIDTLNFCVRAAEEDMGEVCLSECKIKSNIPKGMSVQECRVVLMRFISITHLKDIVFSCVRNELREAGFGNSGEGLDAWEWEYNQTLVMVGTEYERIS